MQQPEQLSDENQWICNQCKTHQKAKKYLDIYSPPKFLIL